MPMRNKTFAPSLVVGLPPITGAVLNKPGLCACVYICVSVVNVCVR